MKETLKFSITLSIICLIASGLLAFVNRTTAPLILAQKRAEEKKNIKAVFPQAENFIPYKEDEKILYYEALDSFGNVLGYAAKAEGKGYSSIIETIFSIDKKGNILKIKISAQNETPGLGNRIAKDFFVTRFNNKQIKELNSVQAITGATISSKAVINSVKKKAEEISTIIGD